MTSITQRHAGALVIALAAAVLAIILAGTHYAFALSTTLSPGDSGPAVSELQTFLASDTSVYPQGLVTGYYGSLTSAAVERFQCQYDIVCSGDVATTGYGQVGPETLAQINDLETPVTVNFSEITLPVSVNVSAPVIGTPTVVTAPTSAAIYWTTNELAYGSVLYSTIPPADRFDSFATMSSVTDPALGLSSSITLTGLLPNTTYYYVLESTDASGNLQLSIDHSFTTNP